MKDSEQTESETVTTSPKRRWILKGALSIIAIVLLSGGVYGYTYAQTPTHMRRPSYQHYHFRTQILIDGTPVDFSQDQFQVMTATAASCSAEVGSVPIDFHDKMDQLTHVHWDGMTGGEFLKYFGWNYIGGGDELLGRRFDAGVMPQSVKIFGKLLPAVPAESNYFVYVGDKQNHERKKWEDFLSQDLEVFFGNESTIGRKTSQPKKGILDLLFPKVSAHGEVVDEHPSTKSDEELSRINNLIGNIVIFVQKDEPSSEQIQARFDKLVELKESTCGD